MHMRDVTPFTRNPMRESIIFDRWETDGERGQP